MKSCRRVFLLPVLSIVLAAAPSPGEQPIPTKKAPPPRYQLPTDRLPGRLNLEEYYKLEDPREAAALLLSEAALVGWDVDREWESPPRRGVFLGMGTIEPDLNNRSFFRRVATLAQEGEATRELICVLKMSRVLTLRETSELLAMGVKIYRTIPFYSYIVRVTPKTAMQLGSMPAVEWMDDLRPEQKYPPDQQFEPDYRISVFSLLEDTPECRADLERLGGDIVGFGSTGLYHHRWEYYVVRADVSRISEIAALWWVQMIEQDGGGDVNDAVVAHTDSPDSSGTAPLAFSSFLRPLDSRRLVSHGKGERFKGYDQTLLVYERACNWMHSDLQPNSTGSSPANVGSKADIQHGTMVAGVAVGLQNQSVLGGGVSGIAPGARFRYLLRVPPYEEVRVAAESGFWLQNHSWGQTLGNYADSLGAYTRAARNFDEWAGQYGALFIKSAGNEGANITYGPAAIGSPGTGKNVLTVGAVHYITEGSDTLGMMAPYSSQGPTRNDILKPELVAPGGSGGSCAERGVVSCGLDSVFCKQWDGVELYSAAKGTSVATAHVSGAAAVIAEAYDEWYRLNHYQDPDYAPSGLLMRALLVNTAIPVRWNGSWPNRHIGGSPADTLATGEFLSGLANTEYGYGLVNGYSAVHSPDSEYRRVLVWQGVVSGVGTPAERDMSLRIYDDYGNIIRPRYLLVTMTYNDRPGAGMVDRLKLKLIDPSSRTYEYQVPPLTSLVPGATQKIIIPRPDVSRGGNWKVYVTFESTSSGRLFPQQSFAVVADVMLNAPVLQVIGLKSETNPYDVRTGQSLDLLVTVQNGGGNVAAGVTVRIHDPTFKLPHSNEINRDIYIGNLVKQGDREKKIFTLGPFQVPGDYDVDIVVGVINKLVDGGRYPLTRRVKVRVREFRKVDGKVVMLPGWNESVKDADILIDGIPSGKRTLSDGKYSVEVPKNFAGTIRARKGTSVFIPEVRDYAGTPVSQDKPDQDFEHEFRKIKGRIFDENASGVGGIIMIPRNAPGTTLRASPSVMTQTNGSFEVFVEHGWSGWLEPQPSERYASYALVDPLQAWYDSVTVDVLNHDYTTRVAVPWAVDGELVTTTARIPTRPQLVPDGLGGAVVVWSDTRTTANGPDIWAQRIGGAGIEWAASQMPVCEAPGSQDTHRIARLGDGTFIVAWVDGRNGQRDVFAQRLDLEGQPLWALNGVPLCSAAGDQQNIQLVATSDGAAVVVWEDLRGGESAVYAQRILSDGTATWQPDGLLIAAGPGQSVEPRLAADEDGGVFLVWEHYEGGVSRVSCARMTGSGSFIWGATGGTAVSEISIANPGTRRARIASSLDGSCLVVFARYGEAKLQKLNSVGNALWVSGGVAIRNGRDPLPLVIAAADGGAVVASVGTTCPLNQGCETTTRVQRVDAAGERLWGDGSDGPEVSPGSQTDTPEIIAIDSGLIISFRRWPVDSDHSTDDIYLQRFDDTGSRLWGSGLPLCRATGRQSYVSATSDLVSGVIASWFDERVPAEGRIYVGRANDTTRSFVINGRVEDQTGTPVPGVVLKAARGDDVVGSNKSRLDGTFALGVPEFWSGEIVARPRGYLNQATPPIHYVAPVTSNVAGVQFRLSHAVTTWNSTGLALADPSADADVSVSVASVGGNGCFVAWEDERASNHPLVMGQHVDSSGDIRWTTGGDPIAGEEFADRAPLAVPSTNSKCFFVWTRSLDYYVTGVASGIWGQLLDQDMSSYWGDRGLNLVPGDQFGYIGACPDDTGGMFLCWNDLAQQELRVQRFAADGSAVWPSPLVISVGVLVAPPLLLPDRAGGILVGWQHAFYLYVQRITASGSTLWGGSNPWEPMTVRAMAFMTPGDFRLTHDSSNGAQVAWSERTQIDSVDERIRINWVEPEGTRMLGGAGAPLNEGSAVQIIGDAATDPNGHILLAYTEYSPPTSRLVAQRVVPHVGGTVSLPWGDDGKTISTGVIGPRVSRMFANDAYEMLVFWRQSGDLCAQRIDWNGKFLWLDRAYRVVRGNVGSTDRMSVASDGSNGAYVAWRPDIYGSSLFTTRHSDSLLINASVNVTATVRKPNQTMAPMEGGYAVTCPAGDEDAMVVRVDLEGDMMNFISAEAVQLVPRGGSPVLFEAAYADSAPRWHGDRFRTTVTVGEMGGCGEDSATVEIYGMPVSTARFSVRSPDIETEQTPGRVGLPDLSKFGTHYCGGSPGCSAPYSPCADYVGDDGVVSTADFGKFGAHYDHEAYWAPSLLAAARQGTGSVVLTFDAVETVGEERHIPVHVALEGVAPYSVAFVALRNENPNLQFHGWQQNSAYQPKTICTEALRGGQRQVLLAALSGKNTVAQAAELGVLRLKVAGEGDVELTDDDLALVTGDLLDISGQVQSVSPRRDLKPRTYRFALGQNYPNPFNPTTTIRYSVAIDGPVSLEIYDVRGGLVKTLVKGHQTRGNYQVVWNGDNNRGNAIASGVYFYRLVSGSQRAARKMVVLK